MLKSESLSNVFAAFVAAQAEMPSVHRSKTVKVTTRNSGTYTFSYAPLDQVIDTVRKVYANHGLSVTQILTVNGIETLVVHESGEYFGSMWPIEEYLSEVVREVVNGEQVLDRRPLSPQAVGSVITYFKRYAYGAINNLSLDDDDDANGVSGNQVEVAAPARKSTPPKSAPVAPVKETPKETPKEEVEQQTEAPFEEGFNYQAVEWDDVYRTQLGEYLGNFSDVKAMMGQVQSMLKIIGEVHGNEIKSKWRSTYQDLVQQVAQQIANR